MQNNCAVPLPPPPPTLFPPGRALQRDLNSLQGVNTGLAARPLLSTTGRRPRFGGGRGRGSAKGLADALHRVLRLDDAGQADNLHGMAGYGMEWRGVGVVWCDVASRAGIWRGVAC